MAIAHRVGRYLKRQRLLVRDDENSYLTAEGTNTDNESPLNHLLGSSYFVRGTVSFALQAGLCLKCRYDSDKNLSKMQITLSYSTSQVKNCENQLL